MDGGESGVDRTLHRLRLFAGFGVELEYMIVDARSLDVSPISDKAIEAAAGRILSEIERGDIAWSNELVLHVLEMKTNGPAASLAPLPAAFQSEIRQANALLAPLGARLMPSAMHPWMAPEREMRLWPHDYNPVYAAFDRIFDCRGHGWANLQSAHLNLPFADDEEFGRLHAAIRLLLPLLPALAASSPIHDGRPTGLIDSRLEVYRGNARRIPSLTGRVIPEPVFTQADYQRLILAPMYDDIRPHDPAGVLRHEWLNSRGAIARFSRGAIEIRVLDVQECPAADVAIGGAIVGMLQAMVGGAFSSFTRQRQADTATLERILLSTIREGEQARIADREYLELFGAAGPCTAGELLARLIAASPIDDAWRPALATILDRGTLSRRILAAVGEEPSRERLAEVYGALCDCLDAGRMFLP